MNIEEVAENDPSAIITVPVNINEGVTSDMAKDMAARMGFKVRIRAFCRAQKLKFCLYAAGRLTNSGGRYYRQALQAFHRNRL